MTAVGAEAERRHATVLAEGIDSEAQLETARAAGATLGQGFMLGEPGPLPSPLPKPGRPLRLAGSGGDPSGPLPYQRVTNWKRPTRGPLELAERAAAMLSAQASALGPTGMLLAAPGHAARADALRGAARLARVRRRRRARRARGHVDRGRARARASASASSRACEGDEWLFATSYDRELVVECALLLMARLPQPPPAR